MSELDKGQHGEQGNPKDKQLIEYIRQDCVACSIILSVTRAWQLHSGQQGGKCVPSSHTLVGDRVQGYHLIPSFHFRLTEVV